VNKHKGLMILDTILILLSLYIALLLKFDFVIPPEYITFLRLNIIPVIVLTILFNNIFNLYRHIWKYASIDELISIVYSVSITNIVFVIYSYFINYKILENQYFRFPFTVHIIFWVLSTVLLGGTRFVFRISDGVRKSSENDGDIVNLLIIGAGDAGSMLIKEIKKHRELKYNVIGLIDDDNTKVGKTVSGVKVLGNRAKIISICKQYSVDEVILAIPSTTLQIQKEILNLCKLTKCKLKTVPGIYEILDEKVSINKIRDVDIEDLLGREPIKLDIKNISKYINNKVVLVTGGGGSIGSELCRQIVKFEPKQLIILDIYENNAYDLQMELKYSYPDLNMKVVIASIRDFQRMDEIFSTNKPNVVFHAAAHKHVPLMEENPREVIKNNVLGTYNVVKCSHNYSVEKFVMISTDKAVNPTNIMGASKRFCEVIIQTMDKVSSTEYVAVRFGNVLGSNGSVIPLFKKQIAHGGPVTVTHPDITRFFMTIPEAAQLVIQAAAIANGGEIFVLDMGEPVKIADLAKDLIILSGLQPDIDIKIQYSGLRPGEKLYEELLMDEIALTSTEHKKIFVEKPMEYDMDSLEKSLNEFEDVISKSDEEIFELMERKVSTYKRKK
jgi:FlaA1/EpsC-like NDP-sugar epimerase